jgi:hypothetical protein
VHIFGTRVYKLHFPTSHDTWISVRFYPYRAQEGDSEKEVELPVFDFSIVVVTLEVW